MTKPRYNRLFTNDVVKQLKANGRVSRKHEQAGLAEPDHAPIAKVYDPNGGGVWLFIEMFCDRDTLYGIVDRGLGHPHLGTASKTKLESMTLASESDFYSEHPLTVWLEAAQRACHITDDDLALAQAARKLERRAA